jgi:hypothetical protein
MVKGFGWGGYGTVVSAAGFAVQWVRLWGVFGIGFICVFAVRRLFVFLLYSLWRSQKCDVRKKKFCIVLFLLEISVPLYAQLKL